jgi:predicted trehalose synthase
LIISIHSILGNSEEDVSFVEGVKAEGNIEDWLLKVEKEMQRTMKTIT